VAEHRLPGQLFACIARLQCGANVRHHIIWFEIVAKGMRTAARTLSQNSPGVKIALEQHGKSVKLVEFEEEGHGLHYIRNQFVYFQTMSEFLDKHIGKGAAAAPTQPAAAIAK
jgi:hypothetical protein